MKNILQGNKLYLWLYFSLTTFVLKYSDFISSNMFFFLSSPRHFDFIPKLVIFFFSRGLFCGLKEFYCSIFKS